jgi:hypothetical protein
MKTKILIGLILWSNNTVLLAESNMDVSLYHSYRDYSGNSGRSYANTSGLYMAWKPNKRTALEIAFEGALLHFHLFDDLIQYDITLAGSRYWGNNHALRVGSHIIASSTDEKTDKGFSLFADYTYFEGYDYNLGSTLTYSLYSAQDDINVIQFSPHIGKYFSHYLISGLFNVQVTGNLINVDQANSTNFLSMEGKLIWKYSQFELAGGGWFGTQQYAVTNNGFNVYNLADKHKGGFNIEAAYNITTDAKLKFHFSQEKMVELLSRKIDVNSYNLSFNYSF